MKRLDDHRFAGLLEAAPDAMVCVDADGRIALVNAQTERLFGYGRDELVGQPVEMLVPDAVRAIHPGRRAGYVSDPRPRPMGAGMELAGRRRDGSTFPAEISLSAIDTEEGILVSAAVRDVTQRQLAAETAAQLASIIQSSHDAVIGKTLDQVITSWNPGAERLYGYTAAEVAGRHIEMLIPVEDREREAAVVAAVARGERADQYQTRRLRKDGTTVEVSLTLSPIADRTGTIVGVATVARDVTERLEIAAEQERLRTQTERDKLERHLHQSQRLESLGQLAGGVAHDFNNLLGVISNYAAFVGEEVARQLPGGRGQGVRDDIEQVQQAAERAAGLTHQLLAFARQEMIQPRVLNINDVVASVEQLLIRTLGEHIELITDLAAGLPPVLADPGQVEQVLLNLAINARDAMPRGGKLVINTASTIVDDTASQAQLPPGQYVALKVSDTGTGIPKDVLDRVFEPFFTTKPKGEGTGLGLATVYGIITQAGGHVRIYSEPGLGTSLTALLPVTEQDITPAAPPQAEPRHGHGQIVLVVEDEPAMREVTRRILDRNGYQVVAAASGAEALDVLASQVDHIDVLLTDVIMPRMQGKELADKIRILQPAARVVFMSGYTQGLLGAQGVLEPGVHLIEKPFSESTLLTKLHEILSAHN